MDPETYLVLSGALSFGVPVALAVRELLLRRGGDGGGGSWTRDGAPDIPRVSPPVGNRLLPDCLMPKPLPYRAARSRVLEDA